MSQSRSRRSTCLIVAILIVSSTIFLIANLPHRQRVSSSTVISAHNQQEPQHTPLDSPPPSLSRPGDDDDLQNTHNVQQSTDQTTGRTKWWWSFHSGTKEETDTKAIASDISRLNVNESQVAGHVDHKFAFATFLQENALHDETADPHDDEYFLAARVLGYQLMHAPTTGTLSSIPFVVCVTQDVSELKKSLLRSDGALVVEVDPVGNPEWLDISGVDDRWKDLMTKLRVFELTQFDKVLLLDSDQLIARRLDDVFEDPATKVAKSKKLKAALASLTNAVKGFMPGSKKEDRDEERQDEMTSDEEPTPTQDEPARADDNDRDEEDEDEEDAEKAQASASAAAIPVPTAYTLAAQSQQYGWDHPYPPDADNDYFGAGFFVFSPSNAIFQYYVKLLQIPNVFDPVFMEQNLLNFAHRRDGSMPWKSVDYRWTTTFPTWSDYEQGAHTLHHKWWWDDTDTEEYGRRKLTHMWHRVRGEMEGFYRGRMIANGDIS